jgi:hypothetical protein
MTLQDIEKYLIIIFDHLMVYQALATFAGKQRQKGRRKIALNSTARRRNQLRRRANALQL